MSSDNETLALQASDLALTSAIISDALDEIGHRNQVLRCGLSALVEGTRLFGRATTVHFIESNVESDSPYDDAMIFVDSLRVGDVAVVATDANRSTAFWGELFSAAAIGRGAVGVVTDGSIRDKAKVQALGFGVFCAGTLPIDYRARMAIDAMGSGVVVGGVGIDQGDLILADDDGVVVIPHIVEEQVINLARARATTETIVLTQLLHGATLRQVWDSYRVL
jgi:regulator of RNase E activity RraA